MSPVSQWPLPAEGTVGASPEPATSAGGYVDSPRLGLGPRRQQACLPCPSRTCFGHAAWRDDGMLGTLADSPALTPADYFSFSFFFVFWVSSFVFGLAG